MSSEIIAWLIASLSSNQHLKGYIGGIVAAFLFAPGLILVSPVSARLLVALCSLALYFFVRGVPAVRKRHDHGAKQERNKKISI